MKEITRIHLAKVAYDIEIDAKKDIQTYIAALERYADDIELMSDIEIRITELLAERGVAAGGVITKSDVEAVRAQLGEPSDFASEDMEAAGHAAEPEGEHRRVYRDQDGAIVGGVLAAIIIYLILWLIIPPAQTAAEKLRMGGHPVTLASIKELGERVEPAMSGTARALREFLRIGVGAGLILAAFGAAAMVALVIFGITFTHDVPIIGYVPEMYSWWLLTAFSLFTAAGLLLATLFSVLAAAVLRRSWSQRVGVVVVTIIVTGVLSFLGGVGTIWYGTWNDQSEFRSRIVSVSSADMPANFNGIKTLTIAKDDSQRSYMYVEYIVSNTPRYEIDALSDIKPQFEVSDDGLSATVRIVSLGDEVNHFWENHADMSLKIYGPALDEIIAKSGQVGYRAAAAGDTLRITNRADVFKLFGSYKNISITNGEGEVDLRGASLENLIIKIGEGWGRAGVVRTLTVEQSDVCPAREDYESRNSSLSIQAVSSNRMTYNGAEREAKTVRSDCGNVIIGSDNFEDE